MPNILKGPEYFARLGKHGHDLSRRVLFTSSTGQLLPVLYDYLSPGDRIRINANLFTRTQPLQSCAFVRVTEHIYYFFVPMRLIDSYFENQYYGINDFSSSALIAGVKSGATPSSRGYGQYPSNRVYFSSQDTRTCLLGGTTDNNPTLGSQFELIANTSENTKDEYPTVLVMNTNNIAGSYYDPYGVPKFFNALRLLSMLGYGSKSFTITENDGGSGFDLNLNPDLLFCYQRIFMDYFRQPDFQVMTPTVASKDFYSRGGTLNLSSPSNLNADFRNIYNASYDGLLTMRYHPIKKDFFTNIQPSPIFDTQNNPSGYQAAVSSFNPSFTSSALLSAYGINMQSNAFSLVNPRNPGSIEYEPASFSVSVDSQNYGISGTSDGIINQGKSILSLTNLRTALAFEKMLTITQRAGKHIEDQQAAHFGIRPPQGIRNEVYYLGSHSQKLQIGEVVATASSSFDGGSSVLGEIAGRGLGASGRNRDITFRAPCPGYIMAIYSAVPDYDYFDYGCERLNTYVSINSFPRPEYDNIGMQPLMSFQNNFIDSKAVTTVNPTNDSFLGWQYRYSELKLSYDVIHGAFNSTLSNWVAGTWFGRNVNSGDYFSNFSDAFYVSPSYLDSVLAIPYIDPAWIGSTGEVRLALATAAESSTATPLWHFSLSDSFVYERDPLLHSLDFKYYKVSWMSPYGLPSL